MESLLDTVGGLSYHVLKQLINFAIVNSQWHVDVPEFSWPEVAICLCSLQLHHKIHWLCWLNPHCPSHIWTWYFSALIWILLHSCFHLTFGWSRGCIQP